MDNLDSYFKITEKIKANGLPVVAGLELTYNCNMACIHCYVPSERSGNSELSKDEYCRVIDELCEMGTFCLVFTGGEPLVRPDFFELADYAKQKGFLLALFTNGTLIDASAADRIARLGFWRVEMSLYGATPKTHDYITRQPGSHEKTLNAVGFLKEKGVRVSLKSLLLSLNVHEYREMKTLVNHLGIGYRADMQINPRLDGDQTPLLYRISREQINSVMAERNDLAHFSCNGLEQTDNLLCNAGKHMLSISPQGDVKPCVIFPISCGNVRETSVREIWATKNGILEKLRSLKVSDLVACGECPDKRYCIRCHAGSFLESGNLLHASSFSCQLARMRSEINLKRGNTR